VRGNGCLLFEAYVLVEGWSREADCICEDAERDVIGVFVEGLVDDVLVEDLDQSSTQDLAWLQLDQLDTDFLLLLVANVAFDCFADYELVEFERRVEFEERVGCLVEVELRMRVIGQRAGLVLKGVGMNELEAG